MKLSNVCDEDLRKVAMMKNRKGNATSDARRAQQILRTRHITHGGFFGGTSGGDYKVYSSCLDNNLTREYKSFEEVNGYPIEEAK